MPGSKQTARAELDGLRQEYAREHARVREFEAEVEAAKAELEEAGRAVTDAYAAEDDKAVREAREREQAAVEKLGDLEHRLAGAAVRAERAGQRLDAFQTERAEDLLGEAEDAARETTSTLQRAATQTVRAFRQYRADRQRIQELVNRIEPGAGQVNGPPSNCAWERELADLERGLKRGDDLEAPLPRWHGKTWRRQENVVAKRLRSERREGATA
jgi:hypothetical protein